MKMMNAKAWRELVLLTALPTVFLALFTFDHPFSTSVATKTLSLSSLNWAQKHNIKVAAKSVDGIVIKPGEEFSFNRVVGPRTAGRGYREAPSYLGTENLSTTGGGICLLSSAIYQAALESGMTITERVPHKRTVRTIKPGLDSTVWYGQADLKFKNPLAEPLQITTEWQPEGLKVTILSKRGVESPHTGSIASAIREHTTNKLLVEVLRHEKLSTKIISRDLYDL